MSYDYLRGAPIRRLHHPIEENPIWKILGSAITSAVAVVIGLPVLLVLCFLLPACLSIRWLLLLIHWNRRGSESGHGPESVKGNDGRWLGTAWNSSVIHAVLIFEGNDRSKVEKFRHLLLTRVIPLYPRLTKKPISLPLSAGMGHCWLRDSTFSIDRHVFTGPSLTSENDLQNYISKLLKDGLPQDKPPWEFQILQNFGNGQDTAAILRVHQSVADGTALLRVLCQSLADSQNIEIPHGQSLGSFSFCLKIFRACIVGPLSLLIWLFFSVEDFNILTRRSSWTGALTVTWSTSITLPKVMRIKQVTRSTVNCVMLSALAGAVRRFLQGCGVKHPPDIKVVLPMDLRDHASSRRISSRLGNKSSSVFVSLPVAVEGCVPRLWATRKTLNNIRELVDAVVLYLATTILMSLGSPSMARNLTDSIVNKASLQFSSIPGPTSEIYVGGQTLKAIYPLLPAQAKLGISITAITYADQVFVSVIAERALRPAAELILEYLEEQIEVLWSLLLHRRVPGETSNSRAYNQFDILASSAEDIASRLSYVQQEIQRLTESSDSDDEDNLCHLRAEFSELVRELKKRQTMNEADELDHSRKPRLCTLAYSTAKKQESPTLNSVISTNGDFAEELEEIKEEGGNGSTEENAEFKEVVCLLAENSPSPSEGNLEALYGKVKLKGRSRNKCDKSEMSVENKGENVEIHGYGRDNGGRQSGKNNETSQKIILENPKHAKYQSKGNVRGDETQMEFREGTESTNRFRAGDTEQTQEFSHPERDGKRTGIQSPQEAGTTPQESHDAFHLDGQTKYLGPINRELSGLYCSNYLQHKLELLRQEKSRLDREFRLPSYGTHFDEGEEGEIAGGVLI